MQNSTIAINLMSKDSFMGSIDLKEAYLLVKIHKAHKKYVLNLKELPTNTQYSPSSQVVLHSYSLSF